MSFVKYFYVYIFSGLFPKDPLERAKVQSWQAWDQTTGYLELAPLLEMKLVSHFVAQR